MYNSSLKIVIPDDSCSNNAIIEGINNKINNIIKKLQSLETPECRKLLDKETIEKRRKDVTNEFRSLLIIKESFSHFR